MTDAPTNNPSDEAAIAQGCYYDDTEPQAFKKWVEETFILNNGPSAGQKPRLLDWHYNDIIKPLLGWKTKQGYRRFTEVSVWVPRKNAKSWLLSTLCIWFAYRIKGALIYCLASDITQAKIVYDECANLLEMGEWSRWCGRDSKWWIRRSLNAIQYMVPIPNSTIKVLSSSPSKSGFAFDLCCFDELAEWGSSAQIVWDKLKNGGASRRGIRLVASTPQSNRHHIGYDRWQYSMKVKSGEVIDPTFLPVVYQIPDDAVCECEDNHGDAWKCPVWWKKANPGYGITTPESDFYEDFHSVKESATEEARWRALRCGQWVGSTQQWISFAKWSACKQDFTEEELYGLPGIIGIDTARRFDLAAYSIIIRKHPDLFLITRFFTPEQLAKHQDSAIKTRYREWEKRGYITLTDGEVISPEAIRESLLKDASNFDISEFRYDPYGFEETRIILEQAGLNMVEVPQHATHISPATNYLERLVIDKRLFHNGNSVMDYCLGNAKAKIDNFDRVTVDKLKSSGRIDGVTSTITALTGLLGIDEQSNDNSYLFIGAL